MNAIWPAIVRNTGPAPRTADDARMGAAYGTAVVGYRAPLWTRFLKFIFWSA